jgi:peptide chain release factor 1
VLYKIVNLWYNLNAVEEMMMEESMLRRLEVTKKRLAEIEQELANENVVRDINRFKELSREQSNISEICDKYDEYMRFLKELEEAKAMMEDDDPELSELGKEEFHHLSSTLEKIESDLHLLLIPKDPNDDKNIIVEIRGAVGGDEANIFAGDLFRMYTRYAESNNWKVQMIDENSSGAGGFSSVSFMIKGKGAYSRLKFESGAHRVQRIPRTEASGRIHTSTATVLVIPEADEIEVVINQSDLQVDTYRSQGAGGQNVNKTESAVRITHLPTGIVVSCQTEKSQIQNREICMRMLRAKVLSNLQAEQDEKIGNERKLKVGTGERSEKIRTYNYPQNRVTDHRISLNLQKLDRIMEGDLDEIVESLIHFDQEQKLLGE